jgi:uncharacterized membrane protein YfcA
MPIAEISWPVIVLALAGGLLAGFINTLAGNGSAITLTILTEAMGLPALVANGTNRIGTLAQSATSAFEYWRSGAINWRRGAILLLPVGLGALGGGVVATQVSNEAFRTVFQWLLVLLLIVVLVKPKKWLAKASGQQSWPTWLITFAGLGAGFYGGFIQMGFGPLFLALAVLGAGFSLAEANVYKIVVVLLYTPILLVAFIYACQVNWIYGLILAVGQAIGAYFTTRFALRSARVNQVAYVVLILVVVGACLRMLLA